MVGIKPGRPDAGFQVIARHPGKIRCVQDVGSAAGNDHLLVAVAGQRFLRDDETGAHIGQVAAQRLRRQDARAAADRTGQHQQAIEDRPHLAGQRERTQGSGMTTGTRAHQDQAVDAGADGLPGVPQRGDVVQHDAAIGMYLLHHLVWRMQRGDHDRHPVAHAGGQVFLQALVRLVHDQVHRIRRDGDPGVRQAIVGQGAFDLGQPAIELLLRARIERREGADHARAALGDHQRRPGHQEHRRADHRQAQPGRQSGARMQ